MALKNGMKGFLVGVALLGIVGLIGGGSDDSGVDTTKYNGATIVEQSQKIEGKEESADDDGVTEGAGATNVVEQEWPICDGKTVIADCRDAEGKRYSKYVEHAAVPETTKEVPHAAVPAKTHIVHHDTEYGVRYTQVCIKTSIDYKSGSCALSQCRDGSYSGSTGRGTCSHHGGVARSGGPWYETVEERYVVRPAWDETVVDVPEVPAWVEIVVVPGKEAWVEKVEV